MDKLNFNQYAKNELLSSLPEEKCCRTAWLSAAVKATGSLKVLKRGTELVFETPNYDYLKTVMTIVKTTYFCEIDAEVTNVNTGLRRGKLFSVKIPTGHTETVLRDTGIIFDTKSGYCFTEGIPAGVVFNDCCAKSYLKSLFVAVGAANVPTKIIGEAEDIESSGSGYYLEFTLTDDCYAAAVIKLLEHFEISAKLIERGNKFVVYVKESEAISNFFALMQASETVLYMQDIMVERMLNNNVNRASNCEVANMDKIAIASTKQILAINNIERLYGLNRLAEPLRQLSLLRLENPEASLEFLAEKQQVTKSCINHRFRKLLAMSDELSAAEGLTAEEEK